MIWRVVKKARLVQVRSYGEAVNLPSTDAGLYLESIKTQADLRTLAYIDQSPRAVFHLMPTDSHLNPLPFSSCSDFEECRLEIQLFFVDRSWSTDAIRIETTFEFHERANVIAVMNVEIKHVPFVEIGVHERLLAPAVV